MKIIDTLSSKLKEYANTIIVSLVVMLVAFIFKGIGSMFFRLPPKILSGLLGLSLIIVIVESIYIYLLFKERKKKLTLKFGVKWNNDKEAYCPNCEHPLSFLHDSAWQCIHCKATINANDDEGNYISIQKMKKLL